jgi:hypothetical protein
VLETRERLLAGEVPRLIGEVASSRRWKSASRGAGVAALMARCASGIPWAARRRAMPRLPAADQRRGT